MSLYPATKKIRPEKVQGLHEKKVSKETRLHCKECNIPLCKTPCFSDYYTKNAYYKTEKAK